MKTLVLAMLAVLASITQVVAADRELLSPDKAFRLTAQLSKANEIVVRYYVAKGYYLYRDKLKFAVEPSAVVLGAAHLPPGRVKEDEFFGRVETYRDEVLIRIPVRLAAGSEPFALIVRSQGCADAGVCYTPQQQRVVIGPGLGMRAPESAAPNGASLLNSLGGDAPASR
jgi:thiol:disulfide interchange protein DsbD